jgi:S-adenosylmethionine hydrolase
MYDQHIIRMLGVQEARLIVEAENHSPYAELSYTFHGRDVYAYVGARLAAGVSRWMRSVLSSMLILLYN